MNITKFGNAREGCNKGSTSAGKRRGDRKGRVWCNLVGGKQDDVQHFGLDFRSYIIIPRPN